jgi:PAS domain S-box-containing protein
LFLEGFISDVTERKRAEADLRDSETKFSLAFRSSPYAITITRVVDGSFVDVNEAFHTITGYTREVALRSNSLNLSLWNNLEDRNWVLGELRAGRQVVGKEFSFRRASGELMTGLFSAHIIMLQGEQCVLSSINDVTLQKQSEMASRRLAEVVEQASESVVITSLEATIEYVNPAFTRVTGYSLDEALGKNPNILKSGKQDDAFYKKLWDTISSGRSWNGTLVNRSKNGSLFIERATISPVLDRHGKIERYVAVKRDVTKELEMEERMRQTERLESVGRLSAGVAHDLNNLLTPILGYANLLLDEFRPDEENFTCVQEIINAAESSRDLIWQLLAFSRKQIMEFKVVDVREIVRGMEKLLRQTIRENIGFRPIIPRKPAP